MAIYTETLASEMAELLDTPPSNGRVVHSGNTRVPLSLRGAAIAVFDAQDEAEAALFAEAATEAGAPTMSSTGHPVAHSSSAPSLTVLQWSSVS